MSDSTAGAKSTTLLIWLWRNYLHRHVGWLMVALLFMTLEGSMLGALSYMMQPMFDDIFIGGDTGAITGVALAVMAIFVLRAASGVTQQVVLTRISQRTAASLRLDLLARAMRQDGAFHQAHPPGFLIQRVQTDVNAINDVWRAVITGAGRDAVSLLALMAVAISVDWRWTAITLIGVPVLFLPVALIQRFVRSQARSARDLGAGLATRLDEIFHGIVPIKLNGLERYQQRQYADKTDQFVGSEIRAAFGTAAIPGLIDVMAGVGFMAVLIYGGGEIVSGEKTVGQFMSFFTAMGLTFEPVRRLGSISGLWQVAAAAIERIKELMDAPIRLTSPAKPVAAPKGLPQITLKDVSLSYGTAPALRGLTLTAEPGKTTALVGASGAGKSTIYNLLTRLVDPQAGRVAVGGVDVRDMDLAALRGLFSVVSQDALLFDETLRENILLGRTDVSEAQLKKVLDAAHVSDFLPNLSNGLDTRVGPRGSALSGGQRQRVVIARALLRDTPILLLDEATSALDAQSEKVVQAALDRLSGGRTTLVIAHRLSTIRNADKIVVMDRGRAVDEGTHEELLARGGIYADLYRLQFQDGKMLVDARGRPVPAATPVAEKAERQGWLRRAVRKLVS
ncbi:ABC transporter ATP-binding protein [Antarcticimicrobium luteum]|uniref:ABC transporter ATP-binding protein n=1 Tax=Antarcticimicrobium luteum TaxID=2547397 RepID=A0A4R5VC69_9RHOB|nr:ABC transporter ATP-binding protein [Antarcticimicrobium luteum]TDK49664.1 ABC transporter ATP-binding protein [Antarcticimicrobium luteum]